MFVNSLTEAELEKNVSYLIQTHLFPQEDVSLDGWNLYVFKIQQTIYLDTHYIVHRHCFNSRFLFPVRLTLIQLFMGLFFLIQSTQAS